MTGQAEGRICMIKTSCTGYPSALHSPISQVSQVSLLVLQRHIHAAIPPPEVDQVFSLWETLSQLHFTCCL